MSHSDIPHSTASSIDTTCPCTPKTVLSPSATAVDLQAALTLKEEKERPRSSLELPTARALADAEIAEEKAEGEKGCEIKVSQTKKWALLGVFSLGMFVDIWSYSAFFIFTAPISEDLGVPFAQQSWVITAYAVTFGAFLLLWGRVSDLYSAKPVFAYGFLALGIMNLVISFLPDRYSFFVLRAISGVAGACLIPAAFRLIVAVFEPEELGKAFTLFGMSGALANVSGIIVAGFIEYIPTRGQGAPWRWFFRILAMLIIPTAIGSLWWIPKPRGDVAVVNDKFKRLDLVGTATMLFAIILLILGLTLGASSGWKSAGFLAPFLISFVLFPFFFWWEARMPEGYALLPSKTWRIPNFTVFIVFALFIYGWWSINYLPLVEIFVNVHGEKAIIAAVRMLPQGISAGAITIFLTVYPKIVNKPRWPIVIGTLLSLLAYVLFIISTDRVGQAYWEYLFPGFIIGSGGMMTVFTATNVGIMTSVPASEAGVCGAILQVALQVGSAVALSIQAGLLTVQPGGLENFQNVKVSWYFELGWGLVWVIGFLIFFKPGKSANAGGEAEEGKRVVMAH